MTPQSFGAQAFRRERAARSTRAFNFGNFIRTLLIDRPPEGLNREILQEWSAHLGPSNRGSGDLREIPLALLADPYAMPEDVRSYQSRDMTVAGASGSNYLVSAADVGLGFSDRLRGFSPFAEAGVKLVNLPRGTGKIGQPILQSDAAWNWLATESTQGTPDQPGIGLANVTPKTAVGLINASRLLLEAGENAEELIRHTLIQGYASTIDLALVSGTGTGQPLGLLNHPDVFDQTDNVLSSNGPSKLVAMEQKSAEAGARNYAWMAGPGAANLLKLSADNVGRGAIWRGLIAAGQLLEVPAFSTNAMPANGLLVGPWSDISVLAWGGLAIDANPYESFKAGGVSFRCFADIDLLIPNAAAFAKMEGMTA